MNRDKVSLLLYAKKETTHLLVTVPRRVHHRRSSEYGDDNTDEVSPSKRLPYNRRRQEDVRDECHHPQRRHDGWRREAVREEVEEFASVEEEKSEQPQLGREESVVGTGSYAFLGRARGEGG